ncbi:hypothetical protein LVD15_18990 [Fulvivirga maritima]|uniref:hypothetical protein n=1 Tax=Fulvivirga maritima TaxID=2904247 RepID=UPI001F3BFF1E|nr:hypothetical protein [Fulvivirga maritima]UII25372.1 hypothetical protein LVD15_18990 [Fulvivirga maritima]
MKLRHFLISILFLSSCSSTQIVSDVEYIRFGSGGGFTGAVKQYQLSKEGSLSLISKNDTSFIKTIDPEKLSQIIRTAEKAKPIKLNEPKNMYQFIELDTKDENHYRWVWGLGHQDLPEELDILYKSLSNLTK